MIASRLLGAVAWIVPRSRRSSWLREWEAELVHLDRLLEAAGRSRVARGAQCMIHTADALEDAVGMWMRNRGTSGMLQDVRVAGRSLARSPGFSVVAVVALALGIGANTAVFSVVRSVVLRPLPFEDPGSLVSVELAFRNVETGASRAIPASEPEFLEVRAEREGLARLTGYWSTTANLGGGEEPIGVHAASVAADFLEVLGVPTELGRGFATGEDRPGAGQVLILSDGLWKMAFGADPSVVGTEAVFNGRPMQIVGVLPPSFVFPGDPVDVLVPNIIDPADPAGRSSHYLTMVARLEPGTSVELAQARLDGLAERWEEAFPGRHGVTPGHPLILVPLQEAMVGEARTMLFLLLGAVGLVLVIACANVASLTLVRVEHRQRESAIRLALGGSRMHVVLPFLLESLIVAGVGAILGLALAFGSTGVVDRIGPEVIQRVGGVRVDGAVLLFTLGMALLTTVAFGLGPAWLAARGGGARGLTDTARGSVTRGSAAVRRAIVVAEIALSVVLVVGSGLLARSFLRLQSVDPGFDPANRVTMQFSLSSGAYPDMDQVVAFHSALSGRLSSLPGVSAFGTVRALPFSSRPGTETISPTDGPEPEDFWNARYQVVGAGFLRALGVPAVQGRHLARTDDQDAPAVAVVNEAMARAFWPGEDPVGRRFKHGAPQSPMPEWTVVGVVGDILQDGYDGSVEPTFFVPLPQATGIYGGLGVRRQSLVVHSDLPPAVALEAVREAIRSLDPGLPVSEVSTLSGIMGRSVTGPRFLTLMVGMFSALALALGAVGVGGLVAYTVAVRSREMGVRMALGAQGGRLVREVMRDAMGLAVAGVGIGMAGAWWASRLLSGQLFSVSPRDPLVFLAAPGALLLVVALAALVPARRATGIDPASAIRLE